MVLLTVAVAGNDFCSLQQLATLARQAAAQPVLITPAPPTQRHRRGIKFLRWL